ncbi:hypothetical protein A3A71_01655 [Candidatus Berkelbacteria bacterium RIFCSPLOWO2_01_FULL_50_28]|uniref:Uncharacterized protein n=1 Tax=Candidatus Berkelbacteria bacterium RIFCSPLOWO2_01_FULL_50_28 TaxID=1797471 RepID=A0A1F5EBE9_9BACT|nr:MAG: hypothetical protein A3F39_01495 [Candidatus Berkelbacteria bacterium RIFCSPHIGHO2_12_FULL_50_11]OGD64738.1 MAG: hypothetical protein A3A71_01655 [Candidatus Berkelbacteria bacterium RIFCSPLOWO2_01_FULL_50_28]
MTEEPKTDTTATDPTKTTSDPVVPPDQDSPMVVPVNQPSVADVSSSLVSAPLEVPTDKPPTEPKTENSGETPILVSESDVKVAATPSSVGAEQHLAEEVETLSGEIQSLQAKIDRLTSGTSVSTEKQPSTSNDVLASQPTTSPIIPVVNKPAETSGPKSKSSGAINDIYAKVSAREKEASDKADDLAASSSGAEDVSGAGSLGTIGEALIVFGLIVFLLMLATPLLKSMIPESVLPAVKSIGWPAASGAFLIGLILMLFTKGKKTTKILAGVLVILSAILFLGTGSYSTYLGPLAGMLDSVFSFYR